jgi:biotin carboxylase
VTETPSVVVVTDLVVIARHLSIFDEIRRRGAQPVVIVGPETDTRELAEIRADRTHPLASVTRIDHLSDTGIDTLAAAVADIAESFDIIGLLNVGEVFVESAGVLAHTLGLPGPGALASRIARDKLLQRMAIPELAPHWSIATAQSTITGPALLKPTGRMSSSGVQRITPTDRIADLLGEYPPHETVLLEELVEGQEYSVESLVHNGDLVWAGITSKNTNEDSSRFFTEMGHVSPAPGLTAQEQDILLTANRTVLERLQFGSGMAHAEFRLSGTDRPILMEVAARAPGDAITALWHLATGDPIEPSLVDLALGIKPPERTVHRRAEQIYLDHSDGQLDTIDGGEIPVHWVSSTRQWPVLRPVQASAPTRVCAVVATRVPGDVLGEVRSSGDRSASLVIDYPLDEALSPGELDRVTMSASVSVVTREAILHA